MGIILLPIFIAAFIGWMVSLIVIIKNIKLKTISLPEFFIGLLISAAIYFLIFLDYKYFSTKVYVGGSYFEFITAMILVPFSLGNIARGIRSSNNLQLMSRALLISVIISGLLLVFMNEYTVELPEYLGLPTYY